jgi:uncharacterized membrane protein HdeD (DUF308 family)
MDRQLVLFDFEEVSNKWRSFLFLGIALILLGATDLTAIWLSKPVSVTTIGALLITGGIIEVFAAKWGRHSSGLLLRVLVGLLHVFVGSILISYSSSSLSALTMLLSWLFLTSGLVRTGIAAILRYPGCSWPILESIAGVFLGGSIWASWPAASPWIVALFVGIALTVRGWSWAMFAIGVRPAGAEDTFLGYARNFW